MDERGVGRKREHGRPGRGGGGRHEAGEIKKKTQKIMGSFQSQISFGGSI